MALTVTNVASEPVRVVGDKYEVTKSVAFDSSYPNTGGTVGEPLTFAQLGFKLAPSEVRFPNGKAGYTFEYDATNQVVHVYWVDTTVDGAAQAEVVDTTNLAALTAVRVIATGRHLI